MKQFKTLLLSVVIALGAIFISAPAFATTYHIYGMGFTNATVSGNLGNYITGDTFIPRSDGSDCTCTGLYHVNFGYYPAHSQPSADYVNGFTETFGSRCNQNIHLNTELSGQTAGYYMLAHGVEVLTPSYADELLKDLTDKYGKEKIKIINTSQAVSETLKAIEKE